MARHAVVDLCAIFRLDPASPLADRLPPSDEQRLTVFLAAAGVRVRADEESIANFIALRGTYEPYVQALGSFLIMPLPAWIPPEGVRDSWHTKR